MRASLVRFVVPFGFLLGFSTAQVAWSTVSPLVSPGLRSGHAMAYDEARGETVLFGGWDGTLTYGDTWTYKGTTWSQRGVVSPAPRAGHAMVYDAQRQVVVMFGGYVVGGGASDETWEWDGSSWSQRAPATSPPPRAHMAAAVWPALGGVVIHGGYPLDASPHFWLWDGVDWQDLTMANTPRDAFHAMAYHPGQQRLLVHGPGYQGIWDGNEWARNDGGALGARHGGEMAYDVRHDRVVFFGGYQPLSLYDYSRETWVWDGLWTRLDLPLLWLGREAFGMVYDSAQDRVFAYGGLWLDFTGSQTFGDTIALAPITLPPPYVAPSVRGYGLTTDCPHIGDGLFSLTTKPVLSSNGEHAWLGETSVVRCTGAGGVFAPAPSLLLYGTSDQLWNGVPLPLSLASLGRPECSILTEVSLSEFALVRSAVHWMLPIPNVPQLAGTDHYFQVIGLSGGAGAPLFTSNGLRLTLGRR